MSSLGPVNYVFGERDRDQKERVETELNQHSQPKMKTGQHIVLRFSASQQGWWSGPSFVDKRRSGHIRQLCRRRLEQ